MKMEDKRTRTDDKSGVDLMDRPKTKHEYPKQYNVILLNDDYTPMDFVVYVLKRIFHKDEFEASRITMEVHQKGAGIAGTFSREIAEMKVRDSMELAKLEKHPLQVTMEQCPD